MDKALSPLPATLCLIIAFLSVCLAWMSTEYLNLEVRGQATLIRLEGRIKELEIKADDILTSVAAHDLNQTKTLTEFHPNKFNK